MVSRLILSVLVTSMIAAQVHGDLAGLHFYLYTKGNTNAVEIKASDANSINNSAFVVGQPVKFLCHGYTSSYTAEFPRDLKNIYLNLPNPSNYNVIAVDWGQLSSLAGGYDAAFANTRLVGKEIAVLMETLIALRKSQLVDFHFIGHSLGGQVGAFITPNLDNGGKIPRVTGLDPARPGFEQATTPPSERLDPTDADFVDVIRTSTGVGSSSTTADPPVGMVDFYPNGGVKQPGCLDLILNLCSHSRAYIYYQESVTTTVGFKAYKCTSYADFQGSCPKTNGVLMGEYVPKTTFGTYYLSTKSFAPFAKG